MSVVSAASIVLALDDTAKKSGGSSLVDFLPLVLIVVAAYLLIIRPSSRRKQAAARLQQDVAVGQEVMTTAGLYATVAAIEDDAIVLEVAPGVRSRYAKAAIARVIPREADEPDFGSDTEAQAP